MVRRSGSPAPVNRGGASRWRRWGPAAILLLLLSVACTPGQQGGPWEATFDDATGWRLNSDAVAEVTIEDGSLHIDVLQPGQVAWAATEMAWADLRLEVDATQVAGPHDNEYGVLLRMTGDERFYAFSISGDGYVRAARYAEGEWTVIGPDWAPSDAVNQGEATNHLEVVAEGPAFEFSVNGVSVLEVEDAALERGSVGLYAGAFGEGGVEVAFDDLRITPLEE
ncbi:MAG: family 16 glycoside hydrolase [Anaerolineae bacterium]